MDATSSTRVSRNPLAPVMCLPFLVRLRRTQHLLVRVAGLHLVGWCKSEVSSLSLPGGREFLMCILGFDTHGVQVPFSVKKYKFSHCSSRCLDPAVAIVTAVELDGISYKSVSILRTFLPPGSG